MMFRVMFGIGGCLSPLVGAACYTMGGFFAAYMTLGIAFLSVAPLIYIKLNRYKKDWNELYPETMAGQGANAQNDPTRGAVFSLFSFCQYKEFIFGYSA